MFPIAAPPYTERICYTTFNYRAGYTADNVVYAKEAVIAAFREYTPSPFLPTPLRPSLWVLTVHLVMYRKQGNVRNYLARYFFQDEGKDGQGAQHIVSLPLAGTVASSKLHGLVGVLAQQQKRAAGIIKHNTNAVKNLAATQAVPGDNVDEGSSPEPPAKKAKQPSAGGWRAGPRPGWPAAEADPVTTGCPPAHCRAPAHWHCRARAIED
eukprot:jgi/Tetstr1/423484/TSEL_014163.t1